MKIKVKRKCKQQGKKIREWKTGVSPDSMSMEFECGGVYHNNFNDERDNLWDCSECQYGIGTGRGCNRNKGKVVDEWSTGDEECNAYSEKYECGGVYNNNYGDVVGNRDHDCFWNCSNCKYVEGK